MGSVPDPPKDQAHQTPEPAEFVPPWQDLSDEQLRDMSTERGFGYADAAAGPVPKELACPEDPPCTDLLADPTGVLSDEKRWPKHLCHKQFLRWSAYKWASSNRVTLSTPDPVQWLFEWPLPVGQIAVFNRLPHYNEEIMRMVPFEQQEEALWAIRVNGADGTADLFGLGVRYENGEQTTYEMGELRYVLRGRDTQLLDLVRRAERWWDKFRGETTGGRPAGSPIWGSGTEFWIGLRKAVRAVRAKGDKLTQENVADRLGYSDRELRRWLKQYGIKWEDVRKIP